MLLYKLLLVPTLALAHGVIFENAERYPPLEEGEWFVRVPYAKDHVRFWATAYNVSQLYAERVQQKNAWVPIHREKVEGMSETLYKTKPVSMSKLTEDQRGALIMLNEAREEVGLKPLTWDRELQEDAEMQARYNADKRVIVTEDLSNPWTRAMERGWRQTIPAQSFDVRRADDPLITPDDLLRDSVRVWLRGKRYKPGKRRYNGEMCRFIDYAQIVSNTTTKVAIAAAQDGEGLWFTVARYWPQRDRYGPWRPMDAVEPWKALASNPSMEEWHRSRKASRKST